MQSHGIGRGELELNVISATFGELVIQPARLDNSYKTAIEECKA